MVNKCILLLIVLDFRRQKCSCSWIFVEKYPQSSWTEKKVNQFFCAVGQVIWKLNHIGTKRKNDLIKFKRYKYITEFDIH